MKKRIGALLLAVCLLLACAVPALAEEESVAVRTVRALGIMVGDEYGNMNLDASVTRAQFAKLLVAASKYRDSVSPDGTGYALYRDLKNDHWASEYIRIAAQEGWMTGYTDSTFRPENTITLEECCASVLRLLGYNAAQLAGSFPYAHLSKASAIGLRDGLDCVMGQYMTRRDCAQLIYNLFSAQTASGQVYGTTLGLAMRDGKVDYLSVLMDKLSGPFVAGVGTALPFAPLTVYRDGKASSFAALNPDDVYYYSAGMRSVWIYTKRVSGKIDAVTFAGGVPSAVTVSGRSYAIDGSDAAYQLSALAGTSAGSYVTLLLGMDDKVAGVLSGSDVSGTYYGVVQSSTRSAAEDKAAVQTEIRIFCADGVTRSFVTERDTVFSPGSVVEVSVSNAGAAVRGVQAGLQGRVSTDGRMLGSERMSDSIQIVDGASDGTAVTVTPSRLIGAELGDGDVRYYTRNAAGEIDRLFLNDVTGDTWTYAYLYEMTDQSVEERMVFSASYTFYLNGKRTTLHTSGSRFAVQTGGIAIRYDAQGAVASMRQLTECRLHRLEGKTAFSEQRAFRIAENAQVYLRQDGSVYLTELNAINANDYTLTGWYDSFNGAAGGLIRIIIATAK